VAAGVFLVARVYPLMAASSALPVVAWVGAITAVFAASIAVAQTDIKRILAYSTVSQLGFMMVGLGLGGVAVGMFHLITHAFFKALLFLGAGSVIHGCREEQDIRRLGGLRRFMPVTFATYAVGMMALSGVPIFFSGFWSKDAILESALAWSASRWPFYLALCGAWLTAFYMTRQVCFVFFGDCRLPKDPAVAPNPAGVGHAQDHDHADAPAAPHESPRIMTVPLIILAVFAVLLGFMGTPVWPWFQNFLGESASGFDLSRLRHPEVLEMMCLSSVVALAGIGLGWWLYGRRPTAQADAVETLERIRPDIYALLKNKYYVDEIYEASVVRLNGWWAGVTDRLDRWVLQSMVQLICYAALGLAWLDRFFDEYVVNLGFDQGCRRVLEAGSIFSRLQHGQVQNYLRILGVALAVLALLLIWGCGAS
jgi:NADH-quinone oxidoreductase subunit L